MRLLALLSPRVWMIVGIVVAVGATFGYGYKKGSDRAYAVCEAKAQKAQKAANDQDLQAEREKLAQEKEVSTSLTQQKKVDDETIEQLRQQLAKRPPGAKCEYDNSNSDPDERSPQRGRLRK